MSFHSSLISIQHINIYDNIAAKNPHIRILDNDFKSNNCKTPILQYLLTIRTIIKIFSKLHTSPTIAVTIGILNTLTDTYSNITMAIDITICTLEYSLVLPNDKIMGAKGTT